MSISTGNPSNGNPKTKYSLREWVEVFSAFSALFILSLFLMAVQVDQTIIITIPHLIYIVLGYFVLIFSLFFFILLFRYNIFRCLVNAFTRSKCNIKNDILRIFWLFFATAIFLGFILAIFDVSQYFIQGWQKCLSKIVGISLLGIAVFISMFFIQKDQ